MNLIVAVILLLVIGLCLWGIYALVSKKFPPPTMPNIVTGIILILIFLLCALHLLGVHKFDLGQREALPVPPFRHAVEFRVDEDELFPLPVWREEIAPGAIWL